MAEGLVRLFEKEERIVAVSERDFAKALGRAISLKAPGKPVVCIDNVRAVDGDFIDMGIPVGGVIPVSVKTLLFR
jgi:ethanolamine utilization protein EutA